MTSPPLLEVDDLTKTFLPRHRSGLTRSGGERIPALDHVSLSLDRHETVALVGESGSGKSTLARVIVRLVDPDSGRVLLDGEDLLAMKGVALRRARRRAQMIFQNPYSSLNPRRTVRHAIAEPAHVHATVERGSEATFVADMLERVGLSPRVAARRPRELSGGQRQRVAIARALAVRPEVLIADEAVSALDVPVQAQILNLLEGLKAELGLTMLFISHQLPVVAHIADRVAVMYLGRIVEIGASGEIFTRPGHPYTVGLLDAQPGRHRRGRKPAVDRPVPISVAELLGEGCSYRDRCPLATELCRTARPPMVALGGGHQAACHYAEDVAAQASTGGPTLAGPSRDEAQRNGSLAPRGARQAEIT